MHDYDHLVTFDETARELTIYRVDGTGKRVLYAKAHLGESGDFDRAAFSEWLGDALVVDSPAARRILGL